MKKFLLFSTTFLFTYLFLVLADASGVNWQDPNMYRNETCGCKPKTYKKVKEKYKKVQKKIKVRLN